MTLFSLPLLVPSLLNAEAPGLEIAREARVVWNDVGRTSADSVPLGNGDIALNVWNQADGTISFYISKSDAWDAYARLIKVGLIRFRMTPDPFSDGGNMEFCPDEACVIFQSKDKTCRVKVRVDANSPLIVVEIESKQRLNVEAWLDPWRKHERPASEAESAPDIRPVSAPDHLVDEDPQRLLWYQRNESSIWKPVLSFQKLDGFAEKGHDPLIHRTFGGCVTGENMQKTPTGSIRTTSPQCQTRILISVLSEQTTTVADWVSSILEQQTKMESLNSSSQWAAHVDWWKEFWNRSWIRSSGFPEARQVNNSYIWQRFMMACAGRGIYPIKFNGALFTADWVIPEDQRSGVPIEPADADYRRWGGWYWFQNTRLIYWAMLGAGDYEEMLPLFRMYREMLPFAEYRTREWYHHSGANFFETFNFFGPIRQYDYGMDRKAREASDVNNAYIRYYWSSGLELSLMMLDYYRCVGDVGFLRETLLPIARSVLVFYKEHYPTVEGRMVIEPSQSLEQFHDVRNPLPPIAGLRSVIARLLSVKSAEITLADRTSWQAILDSLPALPIGDDGGRKYLLPAEVLLDPSPRNTENPELYAIFPYRLYGIGLPDIELARTTFEMRKIKATNGWRQDAIQAACLGLGSEAANDILINAASSFSGARFKGFRGPNNDWIPDMDHGAVLMIAMQNMLCQTVDKTAFLMPAWPKSWNVDFKMPLRVGEAISGSYKDGEFTYELSAPKNRWKIIKN